MAEESNKNWWATLPGILTASAAVITALTGLIVAISGSNKTSSSAPTTNLSAPTPDSVNPAATPAKPPSAAPTASNEKTAGFAITGNWSGRAGEPGKGTFQVDLSINASCTFNQACGTIAVSDGVGPCYGEVSLKQDVDGEYEFDVLRFDARSNKDICKPGAGEYFRLGSNGKLRYRTGYSQATGTLEKR